MCVIPKFLNYVLQFGILGTKTAKTDNSEEDDKKKSQDGGMSTREAQFTWRFEPRLVSYISTNILIFS